MYQLEIWGFCTLNLKLYKVVSCSILAVADSGCLVEEGFEDENFRDNEADGC